MPTLERSEYMRRWYQANRERVLEQKRLGRINEPERYHGYDRRMDAKRRDDSEHVTERNRRSRDKRAARRALLPPRANEAAFDVITPESAYWIGFLMADGCVHENMILLQLGATDYGHVQKFAAFLGLSRDPYMNAGKAVITCRSVRMAASLAAFGVLPRKSKTAQVVGLENNRDFWRGVVDGDGSINFPRRLKEYPILSVCGALGLMTQFRDYASTVLSGRPIVVHPHKRIHAVSSGGTYAVGVIRNLYEGCTVSLDRKLQLAHRAMARKFGRNCGRANSYIRAPAVSL
jgi:hypothetical protein